MPMNNADSGREEPPYRRHGVEGKGRKLIHKTPSG